MNAFKRELDLANLLKKKSFFLFGPRATGKSFLIKQSLGKIALVINLLQSQLYLKLAGNPSELEDLIDADLQRIDSKAGAPRIIVIDEVQKIPALLDEVHRLIEERGLRFLLTGSSARKLKYGNANLLAGRAWTANLFPLVSNEIPNFKLDHFLRYGGLPVVYQSEDPIEELNAYVRTYLYEEIQAEGLVRKIPQFSRFLTTAALSSGQLLNYAQLSSDCGVPASTIKEHYSILEDTLLGFQLAPWLHSQKRKAISTAKFYFFDTGVTHTLAGTQTLDRNSDLYGRSFEQWIAMELKAYLSYRRILEPLSFWRSTHDLEVDFIVGDHTAIDVKATKRVTQKHLKGLKALSEERHFKKLILISQDPIETLKEGIFCIHWKTFLNDIWSDKLIES
jgi:predicted AAA+ superfamily ATPase